MRATNRRASVVLAVLLTSSDCSLAVRALDGSQPASGIASAVRRTLGPKSRYCQKIQEQIQSRWVDAPSLKRQASVDILVDRSGNIADVNVARFSDNAKSASGLAEAESEALRIAKRFTKLDAPPAEINAPVWLMVDLSNQKNEIEVSCRDLDYGKYLPVMQSTIKRCWYPPRGDKTVKLAVQFRLTADGKVLNPKVSQSSGIEACDKAGVAAVENAKLPPLPDGAPPAVDIDFSFDFNVTSDKPKL